MEKILIDSPADFQTLKDYVKENKYETCSIFNGKDCVYLKFKNDEQFKVSNSINIDDWLHPFIFKNNLHNIIFGKDKTENIVSCEAKDGLVELFIEKDGVVTSKFIPNYQWFLTNDAASSRFLGNNDTCTLMGDLFFNRLHKFSNHWNFYNARSIFTKDVMFSISDPKEAAMLIHGFTYFKGMKVSDVSVLAFDIETNGLKIDKNSKIYLISNTFRKKGKTIRKLFSCDEYEDDKAMLKAWCSWVLDINPSIMLGHNVFSYDIPFIDQCCKNVGSKLTLGRDGSNIKFNKYTSKFRKDGSQDYEFTRCFIYGREIVDTMFLAYHFDFARKYESYGLKQIIKQEKLEVEGRQFYDAGTINENWHDPIEREKIKKYAIHDADDALALYDLMIPSFFYLNRCIPKSFQTINYSATGSLLNSLMIRSYLQDGHSIPKTTDIKQFEGAISFGVPGIYRNVLKIDFAQLYPSIIKTFSIYSKEKDPKAHFLKITTHFTESREKNKKLAKETGDRYYTEFEQSEKICANSLYGLMGAPGLNFNFIEGAETVTKIGREMLKFSIKWATSKEYDYWQNLFNEKTGK